MRKQLVALGGVGVGAAFMYLFDPDRGSRRRGLLRDKLAAAANKIPDGMSATARDLRNRAKGLSAGVRSKISSGEPPTDQVVEARVRSKLGRVVSHPHAIQVTTNRGQVTLSGPILAHEVPELLSCIKAVNGVKDVINQLEEHKQAGDIPALQGGRQRPGYRTEFMQENWSPAARLLAAVAGSALAGVGLKRRDALGVGMGVGGALLCARGVTNVEIERLVGFGGGRRAVDLQKQINVAAPVETVYDFWSDVENFPLFMSKVIEVRDHGNGQSHWVVEGPGGVRFEWDAVITRQVPNELLAWKSVPGSAVQSAGIVRFMPNDDQTSIDIKLSYNPPAGALGHGIASMLGSDPKTLMDADLMRMKSLIETGNIPHDSAANRYGIAGQNM